MGRPRKDREIDVSHRRCYEALAEHAAKQAGLDPATAEAAAENDQAREIRDCLWAELQRRVGDIQTYAIDGIHKWLIEDIGVEVGRGSVQRLREQHVNSLRAVKLRAERAWAVIEAAGAGGEAGVLEASRVLAGQAMFNALAGLDEAALMNLKPNQILKMCDSVALMSRQDMETRYRKVQLGELVKKFDREAKAKVKGGGGVLKAEDLAEIRKAVFGETA
jgi:hypothetical protein